MISAFKRISESLGLSYPEEYLNRIQLLKKLGEIEIEKTVEEILTTPQRIVGFSEPMLVADAVAKAIVRKLNYIEVAAPLLTFPRATPTQWNGNVDHIDTITGTYNLYVGKTWEVPYGPHLLKTFKGGPQIVPALKKALGPNFEVTMKIDSHSTPSSRFILVFRGPTV